MEPGTTDRDSWLGRTVADGRFRVERLLGAGGMGAVYSVRAVDGGEELALKVMLPQFAEEGPHLARFRREAEVASLLMHPHLLRVEQTGVEADGTPWLLMEFIRGETLSSFMRRRGGRALSVAEATAITRQVVSAIGAAHEVGIVHRDIKPGNIMLAPDGARQRVKVVDLGLARFIDTSAYEKLTMTGSVIGTPAFMAPEQAFGDGVDARADIFSIGAVLHALLTGSPPFGGGSDALPRLMLNDRVRLTESRRDLGEIVDVVERCLEPEPEDRYQSALELDAALQPFDVTPDSIVRWERPRTIASMVLEPDPVLDAPKPRKRPRTVAGDAGGLAKTRRPQLGARDEAARAASPEALPLESVVSEDGSRPPARRNRPVALVVALFAGIVGVAATAFFVLVGLGADGDSSGPTTPDAGAEDPIVVPAMPVALLAEASNTDAEADAGTPATDVEALGGAEAPAVVALADDSPAAPSAPSDRDEAQSELVRGAVRHSMRIELQECWRHSSRFLPMLRALAPDFGACMDADGALLDFVFIFSGEANQPNGRVTYRPGGPSTACHNLLVRRLDTPSSPSDPWELRFRVRRTPTVDGEPPTFEVVDGTDWTRRARFPQTLRVTISVIESDLPIDVVRARIRANAAAFARCLDAGGELYEEPPFRGTMEWVTNRGASGQDIGAGHDLPRTVEQCVYARLGRSIDLPFEGEYGRVRAEMRFEAAPSTTVVVVGR